MQRLLCYVTLSLAMLSIAGCSSSCDDADQKLFEQTLNPFPPSQEILAKERPTLLLFANSTATIPDLLKEDTPVQEMEPSNSAGGRPPLLMAAEPSKFERPTLSVANQYMTLMGQNGAVLTVWALARRNWLWAYGPMDSQSFGNIRNWTIERSFRREHFRFINQALGTCIQAYGNGLIHDTCNKNNLDQDFELMPTSTGSVFLKSVSQQRCVTYNPVSTQDFFTITLATCDDNISPLRDQNWYLTPPLLPATPDLLAGE